MALETADNATDVFIIDVTAHTVAQVETDYACHAIAGGRWTEISVTGKTVPCEEAKAYLSARTSGQRTRKPVVRKRAH